MDISSIFYSISNFLSNVLNSVWRFVVFAIETVASFIASLPLPIEIVASATILIALVGAVFAYTKSFYKYSICNAPEYYRLHIAKGEKQLRNYFYSPVFHQISMVYKNTDATLGGKQYWFGISYLTKRIGDLQPNKDNSNYIIYFIFLTPIFLILWLMSIPEVIIRYITGSILLLSLTIIHTMIALIIKIILIPIPFVLTTQQKIFKRSRKLTFVCPDCKRTSEEPHYLCPECGNIHQELKPGKYGLFRTKCGFEGDGFPELYRRKYIFFGEYVSVENEAGSICDAALPVYMSGKNELQKVCPFCGSTGDTGSSLNFGIQLVGASSSGKTAFMTAFWHLYIEKIKRYDGVSIRLTPNDRFEELERLYHSGVTTSNSEKNAISYSAEHFFNNSNTSINFSIYDIAGEAFELEDYEKIQGQFEFCDGIIIVIDPLGSAVVRAEYDTTDNDDLTNYSDVSADSIIASFIDEFKKQRRVRADRIVDIPVSVVITKTDTKAVKKHIGKAKISTRYKKEEGLYKSHDEARDMICREYLQSIDMGDVVNMLDLAFKRIHYFPVSSMGHNSENGSYEPYGVLEAAGNLLHEKLRKIVIGE
jgi:GTPase SAR1 family protein